MLLWKEPGLVIREQLESVTRTDVVNRDSRSITRDHPTKAEIRNEGCQAAERQIKACTDHIVSWKVTVIGRLLSTIGSVLLFSDKS